MQLGMGGLLGPSRRRQDLSVLRPGNPSLTGGQALFSTLPPTSAVKVIKTIQSVCVCLGLQEPPYASPTTLVQRHICTLVYHQTIGSGGEGVFIHVR